MIRQFKKMVRSLWTLAGQMGSIGAHSAPMRPHPEDPPMTRSILLTAAVLMMSCPASRAQLIAYDDSITRPVKAWGGEPAGPVSRPPGLWFREA